MQEKAKKRNYSRINNEEREEKKRTQYTKKQKKYKTQNKK